MRSAITPVEIAEAIKTLGPSTIDEVARHVDASYESSRAQIAHMADRDLIVASADRTTSSGRPPSRWSLTRDGEHLFPKAYSDLAIQLLQVLKAETGGREQVEAALGRVVDQKVAAWMPALQNADIETRLETLRRVYAEDDSYITVERGTDGRLRLIERNCPFFDVAMAHPELCGLTINTASRFVGRRVIREEKFQAGDGRCVFLVTDIPLESPVYISES